MMLCLHHPILTKNNNQVTKVKGTKTCELCGGTKHFQFNCPYLCDDDIEGKGIACQFKIKESREAIIYELYRTTFLKRRSPGDSRPILPSMPKKIRGLQIHNKFYVSFDEALLNNDITNICIECTIIDQGGLKNPDYTKVLFKPVHVNKFVNSSQTNLVCSWMHTSNV